jgi:hypothetical protein
MAHTEDKSLPAHRPGGQCLNAVRHGLRSTLSLLPDESPIAYGMLVARVRREFKPATATEKLLTKLIADSLWRLRRADRLEAGLYVYSAAKAEGRRSQGDEEDAPLPLGRAFTFNSQTFLTLARFRASIERPLFRALSQLQASQAARLGQPADGSEPIDVSPSDLYTPRAANGRKVNAG